MKAKALHDLRIVSRHVSQAVESALEAGRGLLRLAPCWVPRAMLVPGRRLRLHEDDLYAYGAHRGGIDERWFSSTTIALNEGRTFDEGLSYCVLGRQRVTLKDAIASCGETLLGSRLWRRYRRWPVYAKFFDNMGPIPHHLHQNDKQAALVKQEGKPESYYYPPQMNPVGNHFPYTFFGLEPGTTREQVRRCLEGWHRGDNHILNLSKAYRLQPGTGWLVGPRLLHAPGSLCTFEPQWGSDVFAMYQNFVDGRFMPWDLLVKSMPRSKHKDLDYILDVIDWDANLDPRFKDHHYLEPIAVADTATEGYADRWIVYGKIDGRQLFTAKELTVEPGASCTVADRGAYGLICVQGRGSINGNALSSPALIRFGELTDDEYFCTESAARAGVRYENHSDREPLVVLRYFGPDANPDAPQVGDHRRR
jgi:hypothetical protein